MKWKKERIQLVTHRLSNSRHLHGDTLHQIKTLACHCDGPATTVTHTDTESHISAMT